MKTLALGLLLFCMSGLAMADAQVEPEQEPLLDHSVLANTAYQNNKTLAAEADQKFAHAMEIFDSKFSTGSVSEFMADLNRAALIGHQGSAGFLCVFYSNEKLGAAFFRQGYVWCRFAQVYFAGKDAAKEKQANTKLAYIIERLGKLNLLAAQEAEQYYLQRMRDLAHGIDPEVLR